MNAKTNGELPIKLGDVLQVGLVVRDLKKSMETYWTLLGIGPWKIYTYAPPMLCEATLRGTRTEYSMRIACAQAGPTQLELIEPLNGPSIYKEHLAAKGEGSITSSRESRAISKTSSLPLRRAGSAYSWVGSSVRGSSTTSTPSRRWASSTRSSSERAVRRRRPCIRRNHRATPRVGANRTVRDYPRLRRACQPRSTAVMAARIHPSAWAMLACHGAAQSRSGV